MGVERLSSAASSSSSSVGSRLCFPEDLMTSVDADLMCANKAFEAFKVCFLINFAPNELHRLFIPVRCSIVLQEMTPLS